MSVTYGNGLEQELEGGLPEAFMLASAPPINH